MSIFVVHKCFDFIPNKFELVLLAAKRSRDISLKGSKVFVEPLKDKITVISLREIAHGYKNNFLDDK
jgi:DNA-directed RNA polymerase subunit omega